jgi:hypothetical protein
MEATIENLRNGKCAVKNDGTLEELNKVLKAAFPKDGLVVGIKSYYSKSGSWSWIGQNYTNIPSFSVKEFLKNMNQQPTMKNRTLTPKQAQSIIDIACGAWKLKLADK